AATHIYTLSLHDALPISLELVEDLLQRAHGSVFETISRTTFDNVLSVRPSVEAARAFEQEVGPFLLRIKANLEESNSLTARTLRSEEHTSELQSRGHLVC